MPAKFDNGELFLKTMQTEKGMELIEMILVRDLLLSLLPLFFGKYNFKYINYVLTVRLADSTYL